MEKIVYSIFLFDNKTETYVGSDIDINEAYKMAFKKYPELPLCITDKHIQNLNVDRYIEIRTINPNFNEISKTETES